MSKVVIISGNPALTSRLNGILDFVEHSIQVNSASAVIDKIHVASLPAEDLIQANFSSPEIIQANELVQQADAVIIASPVYKASYTGVLKTFLDLLPQKGLSDKLILPLFIGGSLAHLLSLDYGLKPVLSALGARHILGGVYAVDSWVTRDEHGAFHLTDELSQRLESAVRELIQILEWRQAAVLNQ